MFLGESLLQELKSPWELILAEPVPEVVKFRPADWAEKYFSAQSAMRSNNNNNNNNDGLFKIFKPGNSVAFLHEVVFFIDRPSCLARVTRRLLWARNQYSSINFIGGFIEGISIANFCGRFLHCCLWLRGKLVEYQSIVE